MEFNLEKVGETINAKETMSSLQIAELTGKQHSNVMRDIRNILEQLEEKHKFNFELMFKITKLGNNAERKDPYYLLTKKDCLLLASGYDANLRAKIINRWEELEMEKRSNVIQLPDFTNPAEAAIAWAEQYKAKEAALLEAKEAEAHVKLLVHNGKTYTSSEIAKELGMKSAIALNKLLEEKRIQYKQNGTWLMYSEYSEKGYTSVKQIQLDNGTIQYDRRWTGKERDFIINLLKTK